MITNPWIARQLVIYREEDLRRRADARRQAAEAREATVSRRIFQRAGAVLSRASNPSFGHPIGLPWRGTHRPSDATRRLGASRCTATPTT